MLMGFKCEIHSSIEQSTIGSNCGILRRRRTGYPSRGHIDQLAFARVPLLLPVLYGLDTAACSHKTANTFLLVNLYTVALYTAVLHSKWYSYYDTRA